MISSRKNQHDYVESEARGNNCKGAEMLAPEEE